MTLLSRTSSRRHLTAALALTATFAGLATVGIGGRVGDASAQSAGVVKVKAVDDLFKPARITISKGQTVKWRNAGKIAHNVASNTFASPVLAPGAAYKHRFTTAGRYPYVCTFHKGMKGKVIVK